MSSNLKSTYSTHVAVFVSVHFVLFWLIVVLGVSNFNDGDITSYVRGGVLALLTPVLVLIADGLVSATTKARIVYWEISNPLPASEAFSKHMQKDERIDVDSLAKQYGDFPVTPEDQNRLWYRIYSGVEEYPRVRSSHRNWLFSRDLTSLSLFILLIAGVAALVASPPLGSWYCLFLFLQYLLLSISSKNYGYRFVTTVLAVAS